MFNDDSISVQVGDHYFDLHNCFDLTGLAVDFVQKQVTLSFTGFQPEALSKHVMKLELMVLDIDFLSLSNGAISKMSSDVEELGYKPFNDFDHDWLVNEKSMKSTDHLFIRLAEDEFVRIHGKSAQVFFEQSVC